MGMFDDIRCRYPLPVDGANELDYQTKDTPEQNLDLYEIREDGTLWHETYDIEDRSDKTKAGLDAIIGCMTRVNQRWEPETDFTDSIRFYTSWTQEHTRRGTVSRGWIEWSAYFVDGKLQSINLIENTPAAPVDGVEEGRL